MSYKLGLQAFSLRVGKIRAALMSDKVYGGLPDKYKSAGGGGGTNRSSCHRHTCRSVGREEGNDFSSSYLPGK